VWPTAFACCPDRINSPALLYCFNDVLTKGWFNMEMQVFLKNFSNHVTFRNAAMGYALDRNESLFNDLVFLAAVLQFKEGSAGKKKAMQIQICFCIPKRGKGAANPFAISPARAQPLSEALKMLNTVTILPVKQALTDGKQFQNALAIKKEKGGIHKGLASLKGRTHKMGAKSREIDPNMFDAVVAEVVANNGALYYMTGGFDYSTAEGLTMKKHAAALEKLLAHGRMGANFNVSQMGLFGPPPLPEVVVPNSSQPPSRYMEGQPDYEAPSPPVRGRRPPQSARSRARPTLKNRPLPIPPDRK
jgi:hypothetical protein